MCVSMGSSSPAPSVGKQPDTGPIKSKYATPPELIEQEKAKAAKNKAKSLIGAGGGGEFSPTPAGTHTFSGKSKSGTIKSNISKGLSGYQDASAGFKV